MVDNHFFAEVPLVTCSFPVVVCSDLRTEGALYCAGGAESFGGVPFLCRPPPL